LLSMLLKDVMSMSNAEAGALYLVEEEHLTSGIAHHQDGTKIEGGLHAIPLAAAPELIKESLAAGEARNGCMSPEERERYGLDVLCGASGALQSVVVPLLNRQHQLLGLIILQRYVPIDTAQLAFASAVSDSASSTL